MKIEKLCKAHGKGSRRYTRWLKAYTPRAERRAAKKNPDNAPVRRVYKGYSC